MCNLNIIIKRENAISDKHDLIKLRDFLNKVTTKSYENNSDGDGVYIIDTIVKSKNKVDINKFKEMLKQTNIILTHQRLATSGLTEEYTQPFQEHNFVLAHNGIINTFLEEVGSDTFGFFNQFIDNFKSLKKTKATREEKIIKSVKKLLDKLEYGSFSISLYDKKSKNLYYFKNDSTDIHFFRSDKMLYITTEEDNIQFLQNLEGKFKKVKIKNLDIYRIDGELDIKSIGKIKKSKGFKSTLWEDNCDFSGLSHNFNSTHKQTHIDNLEQLENAEADFPDVIITAYSQPCGFCYKICN